MFRTALLLVAVLVAVLLYYAAGFGQSVDLRFGDTVMYLRGARTVSDDVVFLRIDAATVQKVGPLPWSRKAADQVFDAIGSMGPKRVILASSASMVLADPSNEHRPWLLLPNVGTGKNENDIPIQVTLPDKDGIVRHLYDRYPDRRFSGYAWEYDVVKRPVDKKRVYVNFAGPVNSISNLSVADVVQGAAPEEFLKDRFVVIGLDLPDLTRFVAVPVSDLTHPMSEAEFHANALITLLEGNGIVKLLVWQTLLILSLVVLVFWLFLLRTTMRFNLLLGILWSSILLVGSICALLFLNILLPISGMALGVGLTLLVSFERKSRWLQSRTREIANTSTWELTLRPVSTDTREIKLDDIWQRLIGFASVHLQPENMALALPGSQDGKVQFKRFYGMDESAIQERRRDIARAPYASAITRSYVEKTESYMQDESLVTYLVPLFYPSQFVGFWVISFDATTKNERAPLLMTIGQQVARLLYYSRANQVRKEMSSMRERLSGDRMQKQLDDIDRIFGNLVEEKVILHSVLDGLNEGVAFTDMFGRLLHYNRPMKDILDWCGFRREDFNSLSDFLHKLKAVPDGAQGDWMFRLHQQRAENVFHSHGYRFVVRLLYRVGERGVPLPEGFLLLAQLDSGQRADSSAEMEAVKEEGE